MLPKKKALSILCSRRFTEQPKGVSETLNRRIDENGRIKLDGISLTREDLDDISKVIHSCLQAQLTMQAL